MKRLTLSEVQALPVIHQGHTCNLIIETPDLMVWVSRMTVADGAEYDNMVTVEATPDYVWETIDTYPAL